MKKTLVSGAVVLAFVGGFGANSFLQSKATEEVPKNVLHALKNIAPEVEDNHIEEEYVIYFVISGRRSPVPLSLKHTANVGTFASEVTGKFTLPKDKGITKTFITEATSFNEDISYRISTVSNNIELDAAFDIGPIPLSRTENLSMGTFTFNVDGNTDALTYSANIC
ncbi:hypothetical protein [Vibrio sp. MA40-2]|uniref:hypothetical protein n=1 Tax=Vibrio sp. MA40-2 TaxID=3391828 RepID=UPI0039A6F9C7